MLTISTFTNFHWQNTCVSSLWAPHKVCIPFVLSVAKLQSVWKWSLGVIQWTGDGTICQCFLFLHVPLLSVPLGFFPSFSFLFYLLLFFFLFLNLSFSFNTPCFDIISLYCIYLWNGAYPAYDIESGLFCMTFSEKILCCPLPCCAFLCWNSCTLSWSSTILLPEHQTHLRHVGQLFLTGHCYLIGIRKTIIVLIPWFFFFLLLQGILIMLMAFSIIELFISLSFSVLRKPFYCCD